MALIAHEVSEFVGKPKTWLSFVNINRIKYCYNPGWYDTAVVTVNWSRQMDFCQCATGINHYSGSFIACV